jgi:hypothetical protein
MTTLPYGTEERGDITYLGDLGEEYVDEEFLETHPRVLQLNVKKGKFWDYKNKEDVKKIIGEVNPKTIRLYSRDALIDKVSDGDWNFLENQIDFPSAFKKLGYDGAYMIEQRIENLAIFNPENITIEKTLSQEEIAEGMIEGIEREEMITGGKSSKKKDPRTDFQKEADKQSEAIHKQDIDSRFIKDGDDAYFFKNWGHVQKTSLKPGISSGSLITSKEEQRAIDSVGGLTMFYTQEGQGETGTGDFLHVVSVPKDKVYVFNSDAEGFYYEAYERFQKRFPGQAFTPNHQVAWITKVANENGYDLTVAKWRNNQWRAQTTLDLADKMISDIDSKSSKKRQDAINQAVSARATNKKEALEAIKSINKQLKFPITQEEAENAIANLKPKATTKKAPAKKKPGTVKKTVTTVRAYEGDIRQGVKDKLEEIGLTRDIEDQAIADKKAKQFVDAVGVESALDALRNNDIVGGVAASVWNTLIERTDQALLTETNQEKITELERLQADLIDEFSRKNLEGGRFAAQMNYIYKNSDFGYNAEAKIKEYKDENGGTIPKEVEEKFRQYEAKLQELKKKIAELEETKDTEAGNEAIASIIREVERKADKKKQRYYANKALEAVKDIRKKIRANTYSDATGMVAIVDTGLAIIEESIKTGIAVADALEAGVRYIKGKLKEQGISKWEKEDQFRKDMEDVFSDKGIDNAGKKARVKDDGTLTIPKALIVDFIKQGYREINDLVDAVYEVVKKDVPNVTKREVRDAITGYGKTSQLDKSDVATQLRKMKRIGRILSALEDVANKKRPLRSGRQRDNLDAAERALNKRLREEMKTLPVDDELQENQLKTALDAMKARLRNRIEDLEREIAEKKKTVKKGRKIEEDQEVIELRKRVDELKKEHDKVFDNKEERERRRLELAKKNTTRRIQQLINKIKAGDYSKEKRKPLVADQELVELRALKIIWQEKFDKEIAKVKLRNRSRGEKLQDALWDAWGMTRALRATGEFSFVLIQGLTQTLAHPVSAAKSLKRMFRFMWSEEKTTNWLNKVKSQRWYAEATESKLAITDTHAELSAREELFYSDWVNMIWNVIVKPAKWIGGAKTYEKFKQFSPFKIIERAAVLYLNSMRAERFLQGKQMLEKQGITYESNPEAYKQMADVINTLTGRASLGAAEMIAPHLTKIFFSPRNWASAFKTATPYALWHFGKMRAGAQGKFTPSVAQKMAFRDLGTMIGLTSSFVAMAAIAYGTDEEEENYVSLDPTSSDFLKIRIGDVRIDPWGGKIQQVVFFMRMITGEMTRDGETVPLGVRYKTPSRADLLMTQATNKLAPSASLLWKYYSKQAKLNPETGEYEYYDQFGNEYDFTNELLNNLYPIYIETIQEILKDDQSSDVMDGLLIFYALFGGGVNIYGDVSEGKVKREMKRREQGETKKPPKAPKPPVNPVVESARRAKEEHDLKVAADRYGIKYIPPVKKK